MDGHLTAYLLLIIAQLYLITVIKGMSHTYQLFMIARKYYCIHILLLIRVTMCLYLIKHNIWNLVMKV